jgi:CBS-domain-containing membrane protein
MSAMEPVDVYLEARLHRHRTVQDVMTTAVVTANRSTPYKEIVRLLAEHRISSLPVLSEGWQVIGVVSESRLLAAQDRMARRGRAAGGRRRVRWSRSATLTVGELMTAPPVTIRPDATISAATRAMTTHHVASLPVTGADHELIGIVSRCDLLSVFLRSDDDIICEVRHLLDEMPFRNPADVIVTVRHGIVTLSGVVRPRPGRHQDLIPAAIRLIWAVDGVVEVVNKTTGDESPYATGKSAPG